MTLSPPTEGIKILRLKRSFKKTSLGKGVEIQWPFSSHCLGARMGQEAGGFPLPSGGGAWPVSP